MSSVATAVPAGAAADDIVIAGLARWQPGSNPAVTPPAGFTLITPQLSTTDFKVDLFWKRLTGSDAGSYTFSWTGSMWSTVQAVALTGRVTTGDPVGSNNAGVTGATTTVTTASVTPAYADPDLVWFLYSDATATAHNPPTNFTERTDNNAAEMATRDGTGLGSGTFSAVGATIGGGTYGARLIAVEPAAVGPPPTVDSLRVPIQPIRVP